MKGINLAEKLSSFTEHWQPRTIGEFNGHDLMVVKVKGSFTWHQHDDTDDFFLVLKGRLTIQMRDKDITLGPGEVFVVPKGWSTVRSLKKKHTSCSSSHRVLQILAIPGQRLRAGSSKNDAQLCNGTGRETLRVARRSRAERFYARDALQPPRAARSTRTLYNLRFAI
jgi:hypothetical protein